ncbi:SDR family oxidoreductase [Micromonospora carbonacea]|uniref:SDR family NAD(P)-dependent oxidoreductase n=1 Tax=Micromonospora carbonacea TaxID=47853 RepID=A0A7H8XNM9_9ACTN|nr:SDR family NAD(P)-dependent oxidoreductase [Micromonospora carbonacea]QLD25442.1 SDR family NAD(P)-dependent oxidoreductase [Micromonospora carbonacea]
METRSNVLVTGGSRGIGLALAQRYARTGARVMVTGRHAATLRRAARDNPGMETVVSDIADPASRTELAEHVVQVMPDLDIVVNNAGIQRRVALAADTAPWTERAREVEILLGGPVHLNDLLIPVLLAHGRPATIVNVTSGGAFVPQPFAPLYSAAKAALHSYTVNLRFALRDTAVRVTELIPPAVATTLSGLNDPHGASVDDFADAVFPKLATDLEIGFGPTGTDEFRTARRQERDTFTAFAARFPTAVYAAPPAH